MDPWARVTGWRARNDSAWPPRSLTGGDSEVVGRVKLPPDEHTKESELEQEQELELDEALESGVLESGVVPVNARPILPLLTFISTSRREPFPFPVLAE